MYILTPHFSLEELCRSDTAARLGINNIPPLEIIDNLQIAAEHILEPIRMHFNVPFAPLSGYRSEGVERAITWDKGFKTWCAKRRLPHGEQSWPMYFQLKSHPRGEAFDIRIPGVPTKVLYDWMRQNIPVFDQIIMENYNPAKPSSGWVHASYSRIMNRRQTMELQE